MTEDESAEVVVGMATGSDAGAPGDHLPEPPLEDDERQLLSALQQPDSAEPLVAVEDTPQMVSAAEDDAPLPSGLEPSATDEPPGAPADDPDRPQFSAED